LQLKLPTFQQLSTTILYLNEYESTDPYSKIYEKKGLSPLQGLHWLVFWDHMMGCTHRFGMSPFQGLVGFEEIPALKGRNIF